MELSRGAGISGVDPSFKEMTGVVADTGRKVRYRSMTPLRGLSVGPGVLMTKPTAAWAAISHMPTPECVPMRLALCRTAHRESSVRAGPHRPRAPRAE